jgi:hypothetical protein
MTIFVGIDLGGGRGKTTALCEITDDGRGHAWVSKISHRVGDEPLHDDSLWYLLQDYRPADTVISIAAPLTQPACMRCTRPVCPGIDDCVEPSVQQMQHSLNPGVPRGLPYLHRCTELHLVADGRWSASALSGANAAIVGRAAHLRRRLGGNGFVLNQSLIETSPAAIVAALCGPIAARGYKRDADPWKTRAEVLAQFAELSFAPRSRFAREEVLQNDHRFDAMLCAYAAFLRRRHSWTIPSHLNAIADDDGYIWTPATVAGPRSGPS